MHVMSMYGLQMKRLARFATAALVLSLGLARPGAAQVSGEVPDSLVQLDYRYYDRPVDPDQFIIRPGEQLRVVFVGAKLPTLSLPVTADGKIASPTLGLFDVNGKTLTQARELLMPILSGFYTADQIDITVGDPMRTAITVTGEVVAPGLYVAYTSQRVSELLERAGGVTEYASTRRITLLGGPAAIPVDLDRAVFLGDPDADPPVYGGYHVHVPQRTDEVINIVGYVRHPREIELQPDDDLNTLMSLAGGVRRDGDMEGLFIVGDSLRDPRVKGAIRPRDVIMVPQRDADDASNMMIIFGRITQPGRYNVGENATLASLIAQAGGLLRDANAPRVTVFRKVEEGMTPQMSALRYPIRVGGDSSLWARFTLQSDDSVFVPRTVGYVRVSGEVRNPGLVPYEHDKTATYYINAAGGFLAEADRQQVVVTDRVSRLASTVAPDVGIRDGDEVRVNRKELLR